jgi:hypothetical protein
MVVAVRADQAPQEPGQGQTVLMVVIMVVVTLVMVMAVLGVLMRVWVSAVRTSATGTGHDAVAGWCSGRRECPSAGTPAWNRASAARRSTCAFSAA